MEKIKEKVKDASNNTYQKNTQGAKNVYVQLKVGYKRFKKNKIMIGNIHLYICDNGKSIKFEDIKNKVQRNILIKTNNLIQKMLYKEFKTKKEVSQYIKSKFNPISREIIKSYLVIKKLEEQIPIDPYENFYVLNKSVKIESKTVVNREHIKQEILNISINPDQMTSTIKKALCYVGQFRDISIQLISMENDKPVGIVIGDIPNYYIFRIIAKYFKDKKINPPTSLYNLSLYISENYGISLTKTKMHINYNGNGNYLTGIYTLYHKSIGIGPNEAISNKKIKAILSKVEKIANYVNEKINDKNLIVIDKQYIDNIIKDIKQEEQKKYKYIEIQF